MRATTTNYVVHADTTAGPWNPTWRRTPLDATMPGEIAEACGEEIGPSCPAPESVSWVREQHPTALLVFLEAPGVDYSEMAL